MATDGNGRRYFEERDRLRRLPLTRNEIDILEAILAAGEVCTRSEATLMRDAKQSRSTFYRAKRSLVDAGLVGSVNLGPFRQRRCWIDWDAVADLEAGIRRERIAPEPQPELPFADDERDETTLSETSTRPMVRPHHVPIWDVNTSHGETSSRPNLGRAIDSKQSDKPNSQISLSVSLPPAATRSPTTALAPLARWSPGSLESSEVVREMIALCYEGKAPRPASVAERDEAIVTQLLGTHDAELVADALRRLPAKLAKAGRAYLCGGTLQLDEALREAKRERDQAEASAQRERDKQIEHEKRAADLARENELRRRWERMPANLQHEVDDEVRRRFPTIREPSWMLRRLVLMERDDAFEHDALGDACGTSRDVGRRGVAHSREPPRRGASVRDGMFITVERSS